MKIFRHIFLLLALFLSGEAMAQSFAAQQQVDTTFSGFQLRYGGYLKWCGPEKVYLHLDRTYYASGETIWFAAYLKNASSLADDVESNFVYVDLMNARQEICSRVKIKRKTGFCGNMELPATLPTGDYVIRAYTIWQLNSPLEYMYHHQIKIFNPSDKKAPAEDSEQASDVDVSFYPEGGRYFAGTRSRVAFKVMNSEGKSVDLMAGLKDDLGYVVSWVSTIHDGMGVFSFIPEKGRKYFLETEAGVKFPLPEPADAGASLFVTLDSESVKVLPISPFGGRYTLAYRSSNDLTYIDMVDFDRLEGKMQAYSIRLDSFSPGICHFLLIDSGGNIVAERMFFVDDEKRVRCDVALKQGSAEKRSLSRIDISLSDTTSAYASVSVVRGAFKNFKQDDDIVSYLMLSSELKGAINNPSSYFDLSIPASARRRYLDLLMMVQGWRYYDIHSLAKTPATLGKYKKEYSQSVSGRILRNSGTKLPKNFIFSVLIPKLKFTYFQDVSEAKDFIITDLDFKENTDFFIKAQRPGLYFDYLPKWDGDVFAPPYKYEKSSGMATLEAKSAFAYDASADTLSAAVVTSTRSSVFSDYVNGHYVKEDDLKNFSHMRLIAYLATRVPAFEYNGETMRNRRFGSSSVSFNAVSFDGEEETVPDVEGFGVRGEVKLIVNEMEDSWSMYYQLRLSEIEYISYTTAPDVVHNSDGGAVYIKLKTGVNPAATMDESVLYFVPLGWQAPSKFYSPRYDKGDAVPGYDGFDHRNTVHWKGVRSIKNGRCSEYFCTTDQNDFPYLVVVQGMNSKGCPFYCSKLIYNNQ